MTTHTPTDKTTNIIKSNIYTDIVSVSDPEAGKTEEKPPRKGNTGLYRTPPL